MTLHVHQFRCRQDNYGYLVRDDASGVVAAIDTPDADVYAVELDRLGWGLDLILNTHWHPDHTDGNAALVARYGASVAGPAEVERVTPLDRVIADGDTVSVGSCDFRVIDTGGHTHGHISLYAASSALAFVGDTLFTLGCGRMFEGTPAQFRQSLARLGALPDDTLVYCGHDYTAANLRFALSVDASPELAERARELGDMIAKGQPTVPTTIGAEKATNPFLRASVLPIAARADDAADAFRIVREAKDGFAG